MNRTKARQLANTLLAIMERLTQGQGQAKVSVFDAGAGGGFNNGHVYLCMERDGLILDQKRYTRGEFLDLLADVISE